MTTVFILIGNSDDKLPQADWATFLNIVDSKVWAASTHKGGSLHFAGASQAGSPYQNACWALQLPDDPAVVSRLRDELREAAGRFGQDSVAWAEAPNTEFLKAA